MYPYNSNFRVTSPVGMRNNPFGGNEKVPHYGLDLVSDDKSVCAVAAGTVEVSRRLYTTATAEWGNYIRIRGDSDGLLIYYCHLDERLVAVGEHVEAGQVIGIEGSTGNVTGRHLHIELRDGTQRCSMDNPDGDRLNIAEYIGIRNAIGMVKVNEESEASMEENMDNIPEEWAENALEWAQSNGIIYGDENGNLRLHDTCTREQMIVFLHRIYELLGGTNG